MGCARGRTGRSLIQALRHDDPRLMRRTPDTSQWCRRCAFGLLIMGVLGLVGCARFAYESGPLPNQAIVDEVLARDLASRTVPSSAAPLPLAVQGAPDLSSPDSLLPMALANDVELRARLAALDAALAAPGALARWMNPSVSLSLERHSVRDEVATSDWSVGPEFSVTLRTPADMAARRALADAGIAAAEARVRERFWEVVAAVYRAHARYLTAEAIIEVTRRELSLLDEAVSLAESRVEVGLSTPLELSLLFLTRNQARIDALAREQGVNLARRALEQSMMLGPDALTEDTDALPPLVLSNETLPALEPLLDAALTLRADILLALARFDEADAGVRQAVAAQYPQITLNPAYFFDQGDHVWSLLSGLALPLSINHGPRIEAAKVYREQRLAEFNAVQSEVLQELVSRRRALELALAQYDALAQVADDIVSERGTLQVQLDAGVVDPLTLKRAERQILQVQYSLLAAGLDVRLAAIDLAESAHRFWWDEGREKDIGDAFTAAVNDWLAERRAARGFPQGAPSGTPAEPTLDAQASRGW